MLLRDSLFDLQNAEQILSRDKRLASEFDSSAALSLHCCRTAYSICAIKNTCCNLYCVPCGVAKALSLRYQPHAIPARPWTIAARNMAQGYGVLLV